MIKLKQNQKNGEMPNRLCSVLVLSLAGLTTLSLLTLSSTTPSAHADDSVVTTASVTIPESCSMTGTTDTPHFAELINGTYSGTDYTNGVGQTTLKAYCNDNAGFAIYAIGYTNDEYGNTKLHWSGAGSNSDTTNAINTGIYTSGSTTNSTWSMKLASVAGTYAPTIANGTDNTENFTTWHLIPDGYTKVAYRTTGTDLPVNNVGTGSSLTVTYDAYISATQPAGTYIGQVKYTLVHPSTNAAPLAPLSPSACPAESICYAPNADDMVGTMVSSGSNTPTLTSISASPIAAKQTQTRKENYANTSVYGEIVDISTVNNVQLIAPNYSRPGYGFAGWSTQYDATTEEDPIVYGPNEAVSFDHDSEYGLILYPVWIQSTGNLQGWTDCSSLEIASSYGTTLASITALTDTRDGNVYAVARLQDGNCWMIENLRLNDSANITPSNTQSTNDAFGGVFNGLAESEDTTFTSTNASNSLYSTNGSNNTITTNRIPRYNKNNSNTASNATNSSGTALIDSHNDGGDNKRWFAYGNYYNFYAASASTNFNANAQNDSSSICPKGWRIPLGGFSNGTLSQGENDSANLVGSFSYLDRKLGGNGGSQNRYYGGQQSRKWRKFPNNIVYSGIDNSDNNGRSGAGSSARYWSTLPLSSSAVYQLSIDDSNLSAGSGDGSYLYYGLAVRCIAGS